MSLNSNSSIIQSCRDYRMRGVSSSLISSEHQFTGTRYLRSRIQSAGLITPILTSTKEFHSLPSIRFPPTNAFPESMQMERVWRNSGMGREIFAQLHKAVHQEDIQTGNNYLFLCDMSGTGKSHLLAALVCQLVFEGKRVFYVPVCR